MNEGKAKGGTRQVELDEGMTVILAEIVMAVAAADPNQKIIEVMVKHSNGMVMPLNLAARSILTVLHQNSVPVLDA